MATKASTCCLPRTSVARWPGSTSRRGPGATGWTPGWDLGGYWALTQPMGGRFIYALAMGLTGAAAPTRAWDYRGDQPADTMVPPESLPVVRLAAVLCAALGLALVALRFSWRGSAAAALLLLIPHARADLTRAWAEGPLLLGLGLCAVAFGTRWFGVACGLPATATLTAVGLWPLLLWPRATGARP